MCALDAESSGFRIFKKISFLKLPATLIQHLFKNTFISFRGVGYFSFLQEKIAIFFSNIHKYIQDFFFFNSGSGAIIYIPFGGRQALALP